MMFDEYYRRTWVDTNISPHQTEFATKLRIPILSSEFPQWNYITGVVVRQGEYNPWPSIMPTVDEIVLLATHLEKYCQYYNPIFLQAMTDFAPYDIDGGANSTKTSGVLIGASAAGAT